MYDFANNKSPDGAIEYRSGVFGGTLRGSLFVVRYSQNNDIIALRPAAGGGIAEAITGITGLTNLADPLDLTERANGDLYVSAGVSSTSPGRLTLLRATP